MIGTANPFFATQIWLLNEDENVTEKWEPATSDMQIIFEKLFAFVRKLVDTIIQNFTYILGIK